MTVESDVRKLKQAVRDLTEQVEKLAKVVSDMAPNYVAGRKASTAATAMSRIRNSL